MSSRVEYVMGYEIVPHRKALFSDPPSYVRLHRLGDVVGTAFTPEEARRFGEAMIRAAKTAEEAEEAR